MREPEKRGRGRGRGREGGREGGRERERERERVSTSESHEEYYIAAVGKEDEQQRELDEGSRWRRGGGDPRTGLKPGLCNPPTGQGARGQLMCLFITNVKGTFFE
jgi:hypothetical protein